MSRRHSEKIPGPFVWLLKDTLRSPAWRAMSHGARSLYLALTERYSTGLKNNGRIYLSQRNAEKELGSNRSYIARWFRELQHYGFIVMTEPGCLGVDGKGKSPHWRLTAYGMFREPPTCDFKKWNGEKFRARRKQNPGPQSGATPDRKVVPVVDHKVVPVNGTSGPQSGAISADEGGTSLRSITSIPLSSIWAGRSPP